MAGMKRFVTYIYSYEDNRKGNNIGFAKIEIRGEDCRMELHLRGIYAGQSTCAVYLFREDAGDIEGIRVGEMKLANGNGHFVTIFPAKKIAGSPFGVEELEGIFLISADERIFMSRWREGALLEVCLEHFREWKPGEENRGGAVKRAEEPKQAVAAPGDVMAGTAAKEVDLLQEGEPAEKKAFESGESIRATELPLRNVFPDGDWQTAWSMLENNHPLYRPFVDREAVCVQIELKNLRELPRKYWYLGNNSFLLHGFFNYRYLVVGKTADARWFIGVPGIYQRQERVMAAIFGFPEFIETASAGEIPAELREGEEPVNRFGFWYRYIEE